jgi:Tfp pilus assembly protein PilP
MSGGMTIYQRNQEVAREINYDARCNPQSVYAGKFVGIANGKVVIIADNLDDVASALQQAEPDPAKTFCIEAGIDYEAVQQI